MSFCSQGGVPDQTCPPGPDMPPGLSTPHETKCNPLGLSTPSEAAESGIRSTSGRYASYWNVFFLTYISPFIPDTQLKTVSTEGIDLSTSRQSQDTYPSNLEHFLDKHILDNSQEVM